MTLRAWANDVTERWSPEHNHIGTVQRLRTIVEEENGSRFVFAVFSDSTYRDRVIKYISTLIENSSVLNISHMNDFEIFQEELTDACKLAPLVHVTGTRAWMSQNDRAVEFLHGLNYRRERLSVACGSAVVFWLDESAVKRVAQGAPDFWAWRAGLLSFVSETRLPLKTPDAAIKPGRAVAQGKQRRLKEIQSYLEQRDTSHPSHVLLLLEISEIAKSVGDLEIAEQSALKAKRLAAHYDDRLNVAVGWGHIADIHETRGELDQALRIRSDEMLPVFEQLGDKRSYAVTLGAIADVFKMRGQLDRAVEVYEKSLAINEAVGLQEGMAIDYSNLGNVYQMRGELDRAIELYEQSLAINRELGHKQGMAVNYGNLGNVYQARGELDRAIELYEHSLAINQELDNKQGMAIDYGNLGNVYQPRGELDRAIEMYEKSLAINETLGHQEGIAVPNAQTLKSLVSLGDALQTLGSREIGTLRLEKSVDVYEQAIGLCPHECDPFNWAVIKNNIANSLMILAEKTNNPAGLTAAISTLKDVLEVQTRESYPVEWAFVQNNLGVAYRKLSSLASTPEENRAVHMHAAVAAFDKALTVRNRTSAHIRDWATTQFNLGIVLTTLGEYEDSTQSLERALTAYACAEEYFSREQHPRFWANMQISIGDCNRQLGIKETNILRLDTAALSLHSAFEIFTKRDNPIDWGRVTFTLANVEGTYYMIEQNDKARAHLANAHLRIEELISTFPLRDEPHFHSRIVELRSWLRKFD